MHDMPRRRARWLALGITLVGAALRIATLNTRSYWLDETTSVRQASWSIPRMLEWMANNVHPPFFHTLLHYWILQFGSSEVAVRVFAVVWGIAAIPLVYWVASAVYNRRVGLFASAILALSPFFIWYAQEARMYTMMLVFATVSIGALWRALETNRLRWWALFAVATGAGLMTQYFFVFLTAGQSVYALSAFARHRVPLAEPADSDAAAPPARARRVPPAVWWLVSLAVAVSPLLWWVPQVLQHSELFRGISQPFNYGWAPPTFGVRFNELIMVPVQWLFGFHSTLTMRNLVAAWPLLITAVFLTAGLARRFSERTWYLVASGFGGVLGIAIVGLWQPILESRYFTAVAVPLVILAGALLGELRPRAVRIVCSLLIVVSLVSWFDQSLNPNSIIKWDNRQAMAVVAEKWRPGDTILLIPSFASSIPEYYLPADAYASLHQVPLYDGRGVPRNSPDQMSDDLRGQVGTSRRVWIIATWQETPRIALDRSITARWLTIRGFDTTEDHRFRRIRVTLFTAPPPPDFFVDPEVTP